MVANDLSFFLPTRKGSERVLNKNTRNFAGIAGGIFKIKLEQILNLNLPYEIVISTNDPETCKIAESFKDNRIRIVLRPDYLCLSSTKVEDLVKYVPTVVSGKHVFWLHSTTPFVKSETYFAAIKKYMSLVEEKNFDSLMSVTKLQQFLWDPNKKDFLNHDRKELKWPRTQDLEPLWEINHAFYINSISNYLKLADRIGSNPFLFELTKLEAFDIDWQDDFTIAEAIYKAKITT